MNITLLLWIAACVCFQGLSLSICTPLFFGTAQHWYIDPCLQSSHDKSFSCPYLAFWNTPLCCFFPFSRNFCPVSLFSIKLLIWYDACTKTLNEFGPLTIWSLITMSSFHLSVYNHRLCFILYWCRTCLSLEVCKT